MNATRLTIAVLFLALAEAARGAEPPKVDCYGDALPAGAILRLGTARLRHTRVCSLAFTADGKLVSFGGDYVARTWDPKTGRQLAERAFEKNDIWHHRAGRLSPDGRRLAFQHRERVRVFDVATGDELAVVPLTNVFEAVLEFSPDGRLLAVADFEGPVQTCDIATKQCQPLAKLSFASRERRWVDPLVGRGGPAACHYSFQPERRAFSDLRR